MKKVKVSVIMPVYNSEEYLEAAIASVMNQNCKEMELLLIDDGSTDKSGLICDKFADTKGIRIFHKQNEGICATRNFGVKQALGEYLMFIDNDDELIQNVVRDNYKLALEYDADVVKFGCSIEESFENGFVEKRVNSFKKFSVFSQKDAAQYYPIADRDRYFSYIWNGMYRREWWLDNNLQFDTSVKCGFEDRILNYEIFQKARKQVLNTEIGYRYFQRFEHSTFKRFNRNMLYSCRLAAEAEFHLFEYMRCQKDFSGMWSKKAAEYMIELLLLLIRKDNDMKKSEIYNFIEETKKSNAFCVTKSAKSLPLTKRIVLKLFETKNYGLLLKVSSLYSKYIIFKRRTKGNREAV